MFQKVFLLFVAIIASLIITGCEKKVLRKGDWDVNFTDITFVDAQNGWVVGEGGVILSTKDGGANWTQEGSDTENALTDIEYVDGNGLWAIGKSGIILRRSNLNL